ncbi:adenosylcobinamide-phosphate synthase CbiB [Microvirga terricola]|uniref:Cobalamin biosynthesis protein CobD n=1 Tax=Microvirga terricola TaxID=2719797 RepID=A0ABX0VDE6_9HYPH|nr:adenosylcobinamide-phosphate synthase CbiB [Microvirga terricola]NIX77867.1 cobalamin biosynthesis protein CobD [Microvirga terricola]
MSLITAALALVLIALTVDACVGYPARIFQRIGHPVTWIGALIVALERRFNRLELPAHVRRRRGVVTLVLTLVICAGAAFTIETVLSFILGGWAFIVAGVLASSLIAQRSLHDHVLRVAAGLEESLAAGRLAVSHIVGRDPQVLDEPAVARAAIESLAENFSDGVVAPTLYTALAGLTGGVAYKAINTADSMIGHRKPRYEAYGWAAARLDDLVNLPASRVSACLIVLAAVFVPGCSSREAAKAVWRDARHHRSPNAGWPEAAMAGALGLRLAGPRIYDGVTVHDHWMGRGRAMAHAADIRRALVLYRVTWAMQAGVIALLLLAALRW